MTEELTYFNQKIHLQVVLPVITPPRTGPITPATATVAPIADTTWCKYFGGEISGDITIVREYRPVPPMPCSVRKTINCSTVWENPHASEKTVKKENDARSICFRPKTSASLVKKTAQPRSARMYAKAAQMVWR